MTKSEDTDFGRELIASMQEAVAIVRGEKDAARVNLPPGDIDVRALRERLGLTRPAFAKRFGLAVAAVRDWEQGLRRPDPAARVLLIVIGRNPELVAEAVAEQRDAHLPVIDQNLVAGYTAMAADETRDAEAEAWSEGLVIDASNTPVPRE